MSKTASIASAIEEIFGGEPDTVGVRHWLDTGYAPLNMALTGRPLEGLPSGRIVQMYGDSSSGKTVISVDLMIAAQKAGGLALFMDHERTFMKDLAEARGLNMERGRFSLQYPRTFEESITKAVKWARYIRDNELVPESAPLIVVFDSLNSMVPQSKMEKELDELKMNDKLALAASCSSVFPALTVLAEETDCLMLFLDQIRQDPGIMFGDCFDYHAKVMLTDGTHEYIRKIVTNRMEVDVMSYNEETCVIEPKRVTGFFRRPMEEDWIGLQFRGGKNGRSGFKCSKDHRIFTPSGEVRAEDLKIGDKVLGHSIRYYTDEQHEILLGSILGDGSLRFEKSPRGHIRFAHGRKQQAYMQWKSDALGMSMKVSMNGVSWADTERTDELAMYADIIKQKGVIYIPDEHIARITPRATAIWYLDDGSYKPVKKYGAGTCSIAIKMASETMLTKLADHFESIGLGRPSISVGKGLYWYGEESRLFQKGICEYVPECMAYKLSPWYAPLGKMPSKMKPIEVLTERELIDIYSVTPPAENRYRYDLEVDGNHNYFVSGVLVHNCTKTSGGKAPGFYSTIRIALSRKVIKKDGAELGQSIVAKIVKNKVGRPFLTAEWDFLFDEDGSGFLDRIGGMVDYLVNRGIIAKTGAYLEFKGKKVHRGPLVEALRKADAYTELLQMLIDFEKANAEVE